MKDLNKQEKVYNLYKNKNYSRTWSFSISGLFGEDYTLSFLSVGKIWILCQC